jgi:hypothetical protein
MTARSFTGTFSISGSIPQDTASWTLTLVLTQEGTTVRGTLERREDGYSPDLGTMSRVTHTCTVTGTVHGDLADLTIAPPLSTKGKFRRSSDGIEPVDFDFYPGGTSGCWRSG